MKNAGRAMLVALAPVLLAATKVWEEEAARGGPPISPASQVHEDIPHEGLTHDSLSGSTSSAKKEITDITDHGAFQAAIALSKQNQEEPISTSKDNLTTFGHENKTERVQKADMLLKEMTVDGLVETVEHARTELRNRTIEAQDDATAKMKQARKAQEAAKEAFAAAKAAAERAKDIAEAAGEKVGQSEPEQLKTGSPGEAEASTAASEEKLENAQKGGEQKASTAASEEKLENAQKGGEQKASTAASEEKLENAQKGGEQKTSTAASEEKLENAQKGGEQKASTAASEEKLEDAKKTQDLD